MKKETISCYLLPVPDKHPQAIPENLFLLFIWTVSARQGPCIGQLFSYNNRTKNIIPVLVIPGSFMKFPGSLQPTKVDASKEFLIIPPPPMSPCWSESK